MVSKSSVSSSKPELSDVLSSVRQKILQLEKEIRADRTLSIKEKLQKNWQKLDSHVSVLMAAAMSNHDIPSVEKNGLGNMLASRIQNPPCKFAGTAQGFGDKDYVNCYDVSCPTSVRLPPIGKIPPYTTWIFLDKNQRMAEDQSVVGRRRIYYDEDGSEALVCSDSEEEMPEPEEEKHEYSQAEDQILWTIAEEYGLSDEVLEILMQFIGGTSSEITERYSTLKENYEEKHRINFRNSGKSGPEESSFLNKSLSAHLDSLDNLFCRRCLIFDCRLHGCSQGVVNSSEKQPYISEPGDDGKPCGDQCYIQLRVVNDLPDDSAVNASDTVESKTSEEECENPISLDSDESGKRKVLKQTNEFPDGLTSSSSDLQGSGKKQKVLMTPEEVTTAAKDSLIEDNNSITERKDLEITGTNKSEFNLSACSLYGTPSKQNPEKASKLVTPQSKEPVISHEWKPLEKELYLKGLEIFGRNSCLIARNMLSGLKTCMEIYRCMNDDVSLRSSSASNSFLEDDGKSDDDKVERDIPARSRLFRRRGKARKLKYSWKSAGHPSFWRRIADGKNQSSKQYMPCGCQLICGKECPCLQNGTCCEKYCGCTKSCKNRFRGCHCAKSQCRSRQCPCFAAGRECDPDVCRNCWVSCGDGSLGEPPRRADGQCGNMRLLLRQQQRILLAKSDVAGWGAFLKSPVNKNDYLGEYTGELISHREADKRGKIYDRANSSFLFDLNDQYVLDAYRKGDKLKFANHSSNPNCYAKVMLVAGDHRVGIFANEHIDASEELFYDYRYGPDQAPEWARKPDAPKRDNVPVPQGRAKKHQSH